MLKLSPGDPAPDFTLTSHNEGELNLAWYRGRRNVILAFYPGDWTPLCSSQIPEYGLLLDQFEKYDGQLLAVSVDSVPCHRAWAKSLGGVSFPLMSDYFPHGEVCLKYGVLQEHGHCDRVVFLIDKTGIIRFIDYPDMNLQPNNDELLQKLAELK